MRNLFGVTVLAMGLMGAMAQADDDRPLGQITVTGEGLVMAAPDLAQVSLGVVTQAATAAEALRSNSAAMTAVMQQLAAAGIAMPDMQTAQLNLQPVWQNNDAAQPPLITGYSASNMLNATVRDLDKLGAVLDAVVMDGANSLNGVSFGLSDPKPVQNAARIMAVEDARAKAELMLNAAGADLGRIITLSEGENYGAPAPMMRMAADQAPVPIASGEVGTSAQVTITFEIIQ